MLSGRFRCERKALGFERDFVQGKTRRELDKYSSNDYSCIEQISQAGSAD